VHELPGGAPRRGARFDAAAALENLTPAARHRQGRVKAGLAAGGKLILATMRLPSLLRFIEPPKGHRSGRQTRPRVWHAPCRTTRWTAFWTGQDAMARDDPTRAAGA